MVKLLNREMNGKAICLHYKYGNKDNLLATYEEAFETVKKYPIVYTVLPEKFKDKKMTLAFLEANKSYVKEYGRRVLAGEEEFSANAKGGVIKCKDRGRDFDLVDNGIPCSITELGEILKDPEILLSVEENLFPYEFTESTYDEKTVIKVLKKCAKLIHKVYEYWALNIEKHPKVVESIRVQYELINLPTKEELAFFKCVSLIDKSNVGAIAYLIDELFLGIDFSLETDNVEFIKDYVKALDPKDQNALVECFYYCAKLANKKILTTEIVDKIIKSCPIAGDVLSDEMILKHNLAQSETNDEMIEKCQKCGQCQLKRVVIV